MSTFEITTTREFSAAHAIRLYDGSLEPLHGHNWRVRVTVSAEKLDRIGVVMDFHELERLIDQAVEEWSERNLNDVPPFTDLNPTAENVAMTIAQRLRLPSRVKLLAVQVWEAGDNAAVYRP